MTDIARENNGRFAPGSTTETDAGVLDDGGADQRPAPVLIQRATGGIGDIYRQDKVDGGYVEYADESNVRAATHFNDAGRFHRTDGPANVDPAVVEWSIKGRTSRDPDEGPAWVDGTGEVGYMVDDEEVTPTPEQIQRHGIRAMQTPRNGVGYYLPGTAVAENYEPASIAGQPDVPTTASVGNQKPNELQDHPRTAGYFREHRADWTPAEGTRPI